MTENEIYLSTFYQQRKIMKLPPSAKFIIYLLKKGPMNRKRLIQETLMPDRTVGFALKLLLEEGFITKESSTFKTKKSSTEKSRRRRQDRRIINYNLVSSMFPPEMAEA